MSDSDFTIPISQTDKTADEHYSDYGYKALRTGDLLNQRFSIVRELGSGGFATTYLAVDTRSPNQKKCAVKQLQPKFNSPSVWASAKERLATEAMVLQWLGRHPQIPEFIGHFEENKQFYLVLEFIEGEEFEPEVQRQMLNETQAINFLVDILGILKSVHQQGIIHRDIKPSNLIRRKQDGKMILIDFGAVKEIGSMAFDMSKQEVQTQIIGTPGYMPPEQNSGKPVYGSDIYALGKTVIFGMTAQSPTEWEISEPDATTSWNKKIAVSEAFLKIVNRMTLDNVSQRYQDASAVLRDLEPLQMIGKTIGGKYQMVKYLGGDRDIYSYVVESLEQNSDRYYLEILKVNNTQSSLSTVTQEIMTGFNNLSVVDKERRIPAVIEYFVDESQIFVVQEYVEGKNLAQIVEDRFILSESEVIDVLLGASTALKPFHRQQIIHGNIKPSSLIKRSDSNKIALVDFSLVNEAVDSLPSSKAGYIPPEQIAGRAACSSDIYALGMTAIHVLTGTPPHKLEKNPRTGEVLWHRKARISPGFAKILDKMICLDKSQRYQSLKRVVKDLKKVKHKSKFKGFYRYLLILPILVFGVRFGMAQWAQRAAILEFYNGDLKLGEKQYQQAISYYNNGLKKLPKTRKQVKNFQQVWLKKAKAQRQLDDYEAALQTCNNALRYYQSPQLLNYCKALTLYGLGRYEEAISAYNESIEIDPDDIWSWYNRGEAYTKLQQYDRAILDFKKVIQLDSDRSFVAWNNLGKVYYQQKKYQQAIEAYNEALAIKPEYLPALIGLGNTLKAVRLYDQAATTYNQALEIDPNYHEAWYGKGSVAEYLGQYRTARGYYQKALELKPEWDAAANSLARVESNLGL